MNTRQARYYLMLGLLAAAVTTAIGGLSAYRAYGQSYEIFLQQTEQMAGIQSANLAKPVWDFDRESVANLLMSFKTDPHFAYARVMGEHGEILGEAGRPIEMKGSDAVSIEKPIMFQEMRPLKPIGHLVVHYDAAGVKRHWLAMIVEQGLTLLILIAAILFLGYRAIKGTSAVAGPIFTDEQTEVRRLVRDIRVLVLDIYDSNAVGEALESKMVRLEDALTELNKKVRHAQA